MRMMGQGLGFYDLLLRAARKTRRRPSVPRTAPFHSRRHSAPLLRKAVRA
jgi:hypothetical protein